MLRPWQTALIILMIQLLIYLWNFIGHMLEEYGSNFEHYEKILKKLTPSIIANFIILMVLITDFGV